MNSTVVIVTYNRLSLLKECLQCIKLQKKQFDHVVIVNNASKDGTSDYLKQYENKYHIITETENGGGAKGFMDGVKYAHDNLETDWILLIDDDAMLCDTYLSTLAIYTQNYPQFHAFSGSVKTNGVIDLTHRKTLQKRLTFRTIPVPKNNYDKEFFVYDLSTFCGLFFDAHLINEIGIPNGNYFIWYDDTEYSLRIGKKSKMMNVNSIYINHKTKINSHNNTVDWKGYYGIRNCGDVIKNYGNKVQYIMYRLLIKKSFFLNYILFVITKSKNYQYKYQLYNAALKDMKNGKTGFNPDYSFESQSNG